MAESSPDVKLARGVRDAAAARRIRRWLYFVAFLVAAMVLVGGATRLTDSGLSITEWRPLTGLMLPMSEEEWFEEFMRYQGIPEFQIVNQGMSIDEFKTIYFWEWLHRNFGRLIGIVYAVPFAWFVLTNLAGGRLAGRLALILGLGALQAWAGWYMVQSGLGEDAGIDVSQYRLAIHLALAFAIFGALLWTAFDLRPRPAEPREAIGHRKGARTVFLILIAQVMAGALVAGLRAGRTYNTWPEMDGELIPDGLFAASPWYVNFFENPLTVQFDHRMIAYLLFAAALVHAVRLGRGAQLSPAGLRAWLIVFLIAGQVGLGVVTLLHSVPIVLGLAHQALAMVIFAFVLYHLHEIYAVRAPAAQAPASA